MVDTPQHTILCIDDDESILKSLTRILRDEDYNTLTSPSMAIGLTIMEKNDVQVVLCKQHMSEMNGTEFYAQVRKLYPDVIRIVLTGFADVDAISESINKGHIYKILFKPWNDENLKFEVKNAIEYYELLQSNKWLNRQVLEQKEELRLMNENLGKIVSKRVNDIEIQNKILQLSRAVFSDLPLAVIGMSIEGTVALMSHAAGHLPVTKRITIGDNIRDCFSADLSDSFFLQLRVNKPALFKKILIGGKLFNIYFSPLSAEFAGSGGIIIFVEI
jgi:response regulator RpfG family c-di-GMP phosphodiesterase